MVFYDKKGRATAYTEDKVHIYLFAGDAVAYFDRDALYSYSGEQLGWFENGWIRDLDGYCVFYSEVAYGGPSKPVKGMCPVKCAKRIKPIKRVKNVRRIKSISRLSWSPLSSEEFFD